MRHGLPDRHRARPGAGAGDGIPVAPDGTRRTIVLTSAGMVDGLQVQVMRDETELEAVRRARDSILANISHEFRTPLAAQLASIELLQEDLHGLPREQLEELVASLQRGTLRLTRLIDNLLESVRIESGQLGIRRQAVHWRRDRGRCGTRRRPARAARQWLESTCRPTCLPSAGTRRG